ncbi:proteoglycan 3-like [Rhinoderma darwinii]|uniref:proteoglycan 3-like n=1 Tax=Rhinoderma darwinii TaxID=43563 RepID=UPI003F67C0CF
MLSLLLLLLVGTTFAQESGDYAEENFDQLIKVTNDEGNNFESFDEANDEKEDECDENGLSLSQESDNIEPDVTEKAEDAVCPDKGTCSYHVFFASRTFQRARRICRCRRGNLSSIHSYGTNNFLRRFLRKTCRNISYVWIGVWKRNTCFPYRNIDRSRLDYANWASGQRKSYGRWCVAMNLHTGQWFSLRCRTRLPFLCTF